MFYVELEDGILWNTPSLTYTHSRRPWIPIQLRWFTPIVSQLTIKGVRVQLVRLLGVFLRRTQSLQCHLTLGPRTSSFDLFRAQKEAGTRE